MLLISNFYLLISGIYFGFVLKSDKMILYLDFLRISLIFHNDSAILNHRMNIFLTPFLFACAVSSQSWWPPLALALFQLLDPWRLKLLEPLHSSCTPLPNPSWSPCAPGSLLHPVLVNILTHVILPASNPLPQPLPGSALVDYIICYLTVVMEVHCPHCLGSLPSTAL